MAIPHKPEDLPRLMEGSFEFADDVAELFGLNTSRLRTALGVYTCALINGSLPHDRAVMLHALQAAARP